ncbi:MAG: hypothetical protein AB7T31_12475 [Gemmatimonadales bacterium]
MTERQQRPLPDRRSFLRRAGATALVAPAVALLACGDAGPGAARRTSAEQAAVGDITRPILIPRADGSVHLVSSPGELPAAYVSMERMQLYVDHDYRDQAYWDLRAHISVSTGVWRIPLRGDPPTMAVVPGDLAREFEELSEREWDPTLPPTEGDIRVMRGAAVQRRIDVGCVPLAGGGAWLRAGPWEIVQAGGPPGEQLVREDFLPVGTGMLYEDRECTRPLREVDVLTWTSIPLEPVIPSGG